MLQLLKPLKSHYSEGGALLDLGVTATCYDEKSILMEAFSRPLWALVPFWAGGGEDKDFERIYQSGLMEGTNPNSTEYWGDCGNYDQKFVEMAAIAYGILLAPEKVWEPLEDKQRFADYIYSINDYPIPSCNWLMFNVLVNIALKSVGHKYNQDKMDEYLKTMEIDLILNLPGYVFPRRRCGLYHRSRP